MGNDLGITPADLFRLSNIACSLAEKHGCGISDAIDQLEVSGGNHPLPDAIAFARTAKRFRLSRECVFDAPLFRDPAWDMLLDLLISDADGRRVSISSLCLGSGVPATTALRHLDRLERHRFIIRHDDTCDQRRSFVELVSDRKDDLLRFLADWCREALLGPHRSFLPGVHEGASGRLQRPSGEDHRHPVFL